MSWRTALPIWSIAFPAVGIVLVLANVAKLGFVGATAAGVILIGAVIAAVHHAEVVAHRVGEPFGTLVLAIAVTVIEASLIVSLMLSGGSDASTLARDTVFAAIMLILNGIVGLCLLVGGLRHNTAAWIAFGVLLVALVAVVFLAKGLAPIVEGGVTGAGLPLAVVGIIIAAVVLAPESLAAVNAARRDRIQTSLNLALGSALATIGLTIPTVAAISIVLGIPLSLGIDMKSLTLLALSLFTATLTLGTGRTTVLQGIIHLVILATYLFVTVVP